MCKLRASHTPATHWSNPRATAKVKGEMMEDQEKIIDLIRKCLALTNSPYEREATAAAAKVQELLEKYNLSMAQVASDKTGTPDMVSGDLNIFGDNWRDIVVSGVSRLSFCHTVKYNDYARKGKVCILGREANVIAVYELSVWLMSQLENIAMGSYEPYVKLANGSFAKNPISARTWNRDFLIGAAHRVVQRLKELTAERHEVNPDLHALTVNLTAETDRYVREQFPRLKSYSFGKARDYAAFNAGRAAGDTVGLTPPSRQVDSARYLPSGRG